VWYQFFYWLQKSRPNAALVIEVTAALAGLDRRNRFLEAPGAQTALAEAVEIEVKIKENLRRPRRPAQVSNPTRTFPT